MSPSTLLQKGRDVAHDSKEQGSDGACQTLCLSAHEGKSEGTAVEWMTVLGCPHAQAATRQHLPGDGECNAYLSRLSVHVSAVAGSACEQVVVSRHAGVTARAGDEEEERAELVPFLHGKGVHKPAAPRKRY